MKNGESIKLKKQRAVTVALLWGFYAVCCTVVSGMICTLVKTVKTTDQIYFINALIACFSLLPGIVYMIYTDKMRYHIVKKISFRKIKRSLYGMPIIIILALSLIGKHNSGSVFHHAVLILLSVSMAVFTELYFRGLIPYSLKKYFTTDMTILFSTGIYIVAVAVVAAFGVVNYSVVITVVNAVFFGWLANELYRFFGSLLTIMIFSAIFNYVTLAFSIPQKLLIPICVGRWLIMAAYSGYMLYLRKKDRKIYRRHTSHNYIKSAFEVGNEEFRID